MTELTREQLALNLCEGLTNEQMKTGPKTAILWAAFNVAYYQVNLLAEAIEDTLNGTRFESPEYRDGNGIIDVVNSTDMKPTENQIRLWATVLQSALEQASKVQPGDVPHEYQTGEQILADGAQTRENIDEALPELQQPSVSEIH